MAWHCSRSQPPFIFVPAAGLTPCGPLRPAGTACWLQSAKGDGGRDARDDVWALVLVVLGLRDIHPPPNLHHPPLDAKSSLSASCNIGSKARRQCASARRRNVTRVQRQWYSPVRSGTSLASRCRSSVALGGRPPVLQARPGAQAQRGMPGALWLSRLLPTSVRIIMACFSPPVFPVVPAVRRRLAAGEAPASMIPLRRRNNTHDVDCNQSSFSLSRP